MSDIAIITANYGGYERAKPPLAQVDVGQVDWVYVTDEPASAPPGWRVVHEPLFGHPNRAAKGPKLAPHEYAEAPRSIWLDASFRITSAFLARDLLAAAGDAELAQFRHPWRDCVYAEAEASTAPKYVDEPIKAQAAAYRAAGHPEHWGLWETGVIVRRHTHRMALFGRQWADEIVWWSFQDQLSEPVVLRQMELLPVDLPGSWRGSRWLAYEGSDRH